MPEPLALGAELVLASEARSRRCPRRARAARRAAPARRRRRGSSSSWRRRAAASSRQACPRGAAAAQLLLAGEGVEHVELVRGPREPPLLELAGHRDQPLGRGGHVLAGGAAAPRVGAGAAVGEDPAREHEPLLAVRPQLGERLEPVLVEQAVRKVELGLDVRLGRAGADRPGVALRAEQQPDRLGEDRLPRAGLAGDRVQPGRELELRLADQDQVLDPQPPEHVSRW